MDEVEVDSGDEADEESCEWVAAAAAATVVAGLAVVGEAAVAVAVAPLGSGVDGEASRPMG